jgi:hypothetical protein
MDRISLSVGGVSLTLAGLQLLRYTYGKLVAVPLLITECCASLEQLNSDNSIPPSWELIIY